MGITETATAQENVYLLSDLWKDAIESGGSLNRVIAPGFLKLVCQLRLAGFWPTICQQSLPCLA